MGSEADSTALWRDQRVFGETNVRSIFRLTLDEAFKLTEIARPEALKHKLAATIAIVDAGGRLLYLERPDSQSPNSVEIATGKARELSV
jgi:uncharacterized protein GlcG (DUF336 family)